MTEQPRDVVQEYLDGLRAMGPSERMLRHIDEVEAEHRLELERRRSKAKSVKTGFRGRTER